MDPPLDGVRNMAVDSLLLARLEAESEPRTVLRLYSWSRPTLSLGRSQSVESAVDEEFCRGEGIDIVRRPTGGQAVLHDDELTYAVVSNEPARFDGGSVYGTYRRISEALAAGYRTLGVAVSLAPETRRPSGPRPDRDDPCFVSPSRYELLAGGRKVVGSAQRRLRRAFLQHGSMPIRCDRERLARATRFEDASALETEMAGIAESLEEVPTSEEMVEAFVAAFRLHFQVSFGERADSGSLCI